MPSFIPATEFDILRSALRQHRTRETRDVGLLEVWYKEDTNVQPPVFVLQDLLSGSREQMTFQAKNVSFGMPFGYILSQHLHTYERITNSQPSRQILK